MGEREVRAAPGASSNSIARHNLSSLEIVNRTLIRVQQQYVDPQRISPKDMLYEALDSVQFDIPEVLVEPYKDRDEVVVVVNDKRQQFSTSEVDSPWRLTKKLKKIFRFIEANMNPGADLAEVEYAAVNGMLSTLDPHSILLDPETAEEMDVNTSGKFGGLGIVIRMFERKLTVVRPIKGTPAWEMGIKKGDRIAEINGEVTENLTLTEAVNRMRGDPGTTVKLAIERKGEPDLLYFEVTRAQITVESVDQVKLLDKHVGYIRLKQFSGNTTREVREAMDSLRAKGAKGWILDLRWNPGGLLEQAIQVADLFVDKGTIVTTVGGHERDPRRAKRKATDTKHPVALLVNGSSASASEIVAGALKNLNRALVIGNTTFGKGSVQILYDNDDGSKLKLTIAQYLTPGDRSIQSVGITPDIELQRMLVSKQDSGPRDIFRLLKPSRSYSESDLRAHLTSHYAGAAAKPELRLSFLYERKTKQSTAAEPEEATEQSGVDDDEPAIPDEEEPPLDEEFVEDFEITLARDIVAASDKPTRQGMLQVAKRIVAKTRAEQQKKLAAALGALGVDWTAPDQNAAGGGAQLRADVTVKPSGRIAAGDTVELVGTVTNDGTAPAYQVHARAKADDRVFNDAELLFGRIDPGQSKTWTTYVKVPKDAPDRIDVLSFAFRAAQNVTAHAAPIKFRIGAADRPVFAYSHQLIDEGNGDGLVQKGESFRLLVNIRNIGTGVAQDTTALLRNSSGDGVSVKKGRFEIGSLKPNESKQVEFEFDVQKAMSEKQLVVEMTVYDAVLHEAVVEKLKYPLQPDSAGPGRASGNVEVRVSSAAIHAGAAATSETVGFADKGSVFQVTGKQADWLRVRLDAERPGFLRASDVRRTDKNARPKLHANWQVTPPNLALQIPSLETGMSSYHLRGKATDETRVEDVYIFVSNPDAKVDNKKVFYESNRGGKDPSSLSFDATIPLWPGSNRITVVARENSEVRSAHTMYLYRRGDLRAEKAVSEAK